MKKPQPSPSKERRRKRTLYAVCDSFGREGLGEPLALFVTRCAAKAWAEATNGAGSDHQVFTVRLVDGYAERL